MELISCQARLHLSLIIFYSESLNSDYSLNSYWGYAVVKETDTRSRLMDLKVAKEINVKNIEVKMYILGPCIVKEAASKKWYIYEGRLTQSEG